MITEKELRLMRLLRWMHFPCANAELEAVDEATGPVGQVRGNPGTKKRFQQMVKGFIQLARHMHPYGKINRLMVHPTRRFSCLLEAQQTASQLSSQSQKWNKVAAL